MRVIAGTAKGRPLHAPHGAAVRPTSDKIKGAIFSMLESLLVSRLPRNEQGYSQEEVWAGVRVLDLYAGTGALSIEALSRGAAWADLVEANGSACKTIKRNLAETGLAERARLRPTTVQSVISSDSLVSEEAGYDIIALDPPYADPTVGVVVRTLGEGWLPRANALVVVEHSRRVELADEYGSLVRIRQRTHGDTSVSVYRKQEAAA
ncbi:MAG: RsmD family RNA methyltransferase [Chloroflexota bacterium]